MEHTRAHAGQTLHLTEPVKVAFDPAVLLGSLDDLLNPRD